MMSTLAARYIRKPIEVLAVEITEDNMERVANWCNGTIFGFLSDDPQQWRIAAKDGDGPLHATIGDFMVLEDDEFFAYDKEEFLEQYNNVDAVNSAGIWLTNPFSE